MLSDGVIMRHTGVDEPEKMEAGTTVWCTGIKINPVAAQLAEALPAGTQARLPLQTLGPLVAAVFHAVKPGYSNLHARLIERSIAFSDWSFGPHQARHSREDAVAYANPAMQEHVHALKTDHHLVVKGSGGTIFALGDAATIQQDKALDHAAELFRRAHPAMCTEHACVTLQACLWHDLHGSRLG